jgi:prepilin signal peptidase PulO-like enzyme (type II secretory pathway)
LVILTTILAYNYIKKKTKKGFIFFAIAISLLRLVIDKSVYSTNFLVIFLILIILWEIIDSFLNFSISKLISNVFSREVEVNKLKPGMVLSEFIQKDENKHIKKVKSAFYADNFLDEESEGLTQKQIEKIRAADIKKIRVSQMISFAPFIFLGVILTLIAKGNIIIFVLKFI